VLGVSMTMVGGAVAAMFVLPGGFEEMSREVQSKGCEDGVSVCPTVFTANQVREGE
jgi:hypothetical protein